MPLSPEQLAKIEDRFVYGSQSFAWVYANSNDVPLLPPSAERYGGHLKKSQMDLAPAWWEEHGCPSVLLALYTGTEPEDAWNFLNDDPIAGEGRFHMYLDNFNPGEPERQQAWDMFFAPRVVMYTMVIEAMTSPQVAA